MAVNENCWMGDHDWMGTSRCAHCGSRLRCFCGRFVREDRLAEHVDTCVVVNRLADDVVEEDRRSAPY